jgi:hypothetical protein
MGVTPIFQNWWLVCVCLSYTEMYLSNIWGALSFSTNYKESFIDLSLFLDQKGQLFYVRWPCLFFWQLIEPGVDFWPRLGQSVSLSQKPRIGIETHQLTCIHQIVDEQPTLSRPWTCTAVYFCQRAARVWELVRSFSDHSPPCPGGLCGQGFSLTWPHLASSCSAHSTQPHAWQCTGA